MKILVNNYNLWRKIEISVKNQNFGQQLKLSQKLKLGQKLNF